MKILYIQISVLLLFCLNIGIHLEHADCSHVEEIVEDYSHKDDPVISADVI